MERWQAKIAVTIGIFIIPFVCTVLPVKVNSYFLHKGEKGKKILSCLMCFGGGVFFATFILHMGPEVRDILHVALKPYNITYPLGDLLMGVGFFIVLFMEKLVIRVHAKQKEKEKAKQKRQCLQFNKPYLPVKNGMMPESPIETNPNGANPSMPLPNANGRIRQPSQSSVISDDGNPDTNSCPLRGSGACCEDPVELKIQTVEDDDLKIVPSESEQSHGHGEAALLQDAHGTRAIVLLVALSLHRIFEGLSVGLQHSTHNVWSLFVAVMCHETVIGFSLGLEFVKNKWSLRRIITACVLCSLIMPIGTIVGTLVVELGDANSASFDMLNGIMQAIATGTFIYVTFFEILGEEISPHDTGLAKSFSVLLGFVVMAALCAIPEEDDMLNQAILGDQRNDTLAVLAP